MSLMNTIHSGAEDHEGSHAYDHIWPAVRDFCYLENVVGTLEILVCGSGARPYQREVIQPSPSIRKLDFF